MNQYLKQLKENCPNWLSEYKKGDTVNLKNILQYRFLYYAGSGRDGQPVKTFNQTHSVHTFFYVDYAVSKQYLENEIDRRGFKGYSVFDKIEFDKSDFNLEYKTIEYDSNIHADLSKDIYRFSHDEPYCMLYIFERLNDYDDNHGSRRFAILFLYADAIATYQLLFCQNKINKPFVFVLQDHGFGCGYARFDKDGLLNKIADKYRVYPDYMLVADGSTPWINYKKVSDEHVTGGMHNTRRFLYKIK